MKKQPDGIIMETAVTLVRNVAGQPFSIVNDPSATEEMVKQVEKALQKAEGETFHTVYLWSLTPLQRQALAEEKHLPQPIHLYEKNSAVLLSEDGLVTITIGTTDHIRIRAAQAGEHFQTLLERVQALEDVLSQDITFAFSPRYGYLTADPSEVGTGLRLEVMLHLGMLERFEEIKTFTETATRAGFALRPINHMSAEITWGAIFTLSNTATLGVTEEQLLRKAGQTTKELVEMEKAARETTDPDRLLFLEDSVWRAHGTLLYARTMDYHDMIDSWSMVRLGAAMGLLPVKWEPFEAIFRDARDGALQLQCGASLKGTALQKARADWVRTAYTAILKKPTRRKSCNPPTE